MTKPIQLSELLNFDDPKKYKVHLANWNEYAEKSPLDVFLTDKDEWKGWNTWGSTKNEYNRKYIFSLIEFYHETNVWLFGGIFEVIRTYKESDIYRYEIQLKRQYESMIGRLKIYFERDGRNKARLMENTLQNLIVHEILRSEYEGEAFCGYENIKLPFYSLEHIVNVSKSDWKSTLENAKGVYMIMNKSNGKKYVGSAYGESGIWSRWSGYIETGHGCNKELINLISKKGKEHARENFIFSLLEYFPMKTDDATVLNRESHWKEVLLSEKFGYNKN